MKKQIRTNRLRRYILASGLIMVSFGIWISCSKDAGISSINPTDDGVSSQKSIGTKPAVGGLNYADFHPQSGVNYDPFAGMTADGRRSAIGGASTAEKFLQLMVAQVALAMGDDKARDVLYDYVPNLDEGEIHLSKLAAIYPDLLNGMSGGFKDALANAFLSGQLNNKALEVSTDGEAILRVSKAMFDLSLTVVTPPGQGWNSSDDKIPVFYMPMDDATATTMSGKDADGNPITYPFSETAAPTAFLLLKFDESSPMFNVGEEGYTYRLPQDDGMFAWLFNLSFTSPVEAHIPGPTGHGPHANKIQAVKKIVIYNDHEGIGSPEIWVSYRIRIHPSYTYTDNFDLADVDNVNVLYTDYDDERTTHSTGSQNSNYIDFIRVFERDDGWHDDTVCEWGGINDIYLPSIGVEKTLLPSQASSSEQDARLTLEKTNEG